MHRTSLALLSSLALLAGGCSISSLLNKIEKESEESVDLICACDLPTVDGQSCEETFSVSLFGDADRGCIEDALAVDEDASKEALECSLDVMKEYNQCLKDNLDCDDQMSFQVCNEVFNSFADCPQNSAEVQAEINKCYPEQDGD